MAPFLGAQVAVVAGLGPMFGITWVQSVRAGLLLAAGGEFAFVAFGAHCFRPSCSPLLRLVPHFQPDWRHRDQT